jgi:hypothetical protein
MSLTITLQPEVEASILQEAEKEGVSVTELANRRVVEADLLWRIHTAAPELETRELHGMLRKKQNGTITPAEDARLQGLLDKREARAAERIEDLAKLSTLRGMPVRMLMEQLGIRPIAVR